MAALRKRTDVPLIYYVNQGSALMEAVADLDVDVIGVDWRSPLSEVSRVLGPGKAVQGNLDPAALFAPPGELERHADLVLQEGRAAPGIFSTWDMASGPRRAPMPLRVSSIMFTRAARKGGGDDGRFRGSRG